MASRLSAVWRLNQVGNGYTLVAAGGGPDRSHLQRIQRHGLYLGHDIETFENGLGSYYYEGYARPRVTTSPTAAHDGSYGLLDAGDGNWYMRLDPAAQVNPGDTVSVWVQYYNSADGRAYFAFGTSLNGTLSAVLAPNTGQLLIQANPHFEYMDLAAVPQSYQANHWYRVEVAWGNSGNVIVRLYDSDGQTLLNSVEAATGDVTPGDFGFRAIGSIKDFDTVTVTRGVNLFGAPACAAGVLRQGCSTPGRQLDITAGDGTLDRSRWWAGYAVGGTVVEFPAVVPPAFVWRPIIWPGGSFRRVHRTVPPSELNRWRDLKSLFGLRRLGGFHLAGGPPGRTGEQQECDSDSDRFHPSKHHTRSASRSGSTPISPAARYR